MKHKCDYKTQQEGLAVASIARDNPSIGGGHVCWDRMMASTSLAGAAAVSPACTTTQWTSVTDRQTLTS